MRMGTNNVGAAGELLGALGAMTGAASGAVLFEGAATGASGAVPFEGAATGALGANGPVAFEGAVATGTTGATGPVEGTRGAAPRGAAETGA
jgi:hypothetical protein